MMVPIQLGLIPLYMLMSQLHLAGTLQAVIVPFLVTGFGVFMMRQYAMQAVPDELIEAARVDGASTLRIFWNVVLPALRPAAAVLGLLTFMERWNDFLWPYLVLDLEHPTVQVALSRLSGGYYTDQALVFAGTLLGVVPLLVVFVAVRPPDRRRHHGRWRQVVTEHRPAGRPTAPTGDPRPSRPTSSGARPPRRTRSRARSTEDGRDPVDLGHLRARPRARSATATPADVAVRPLPPLRATTSR